MRRAAAFSITFLLVLADATQAGQTMTTQRAPAGARSASAQVCEPIRLGARRDVGLGSPNDLDFMATPTGYAFAWTVTTDSSATLQIAFQEWDRKGVTIRPQTILSAPGAYADSPKVVSGSDSILVAWTELHDGESEVFTSEIRPGLDPGAPILRFHNRALAGYDATIWNGSKFVLAAWSFQNQPTLNSIVPGDATSGPDVGVSSIPHTRPLSLASMGTDVGVVYSEDLADGSARIRFRRFDADLNPKSAEMLVAQGRSPLSASLAWTGTEFVMAWNDYVYNYHFVRFDSDGNLLGDVTLPITDSVAGPVRLAWTGSEFGLLWTAWRRLRREVRFVRLSTVGDLLGAPLSVSSPDPNSIGGRLRWTGDGYAAFWADYVGLPAQLRFGRIACGCDEDFDGDGHGVCDDCADGDCDDLDPTMHPGAPDLPGDAKDQDCDGAKSCDPARPWKGHGAFVSCVTREAHALDAAGRISTSAAIELIRMALRSNVGKN